MFTYSTLSPHWRARMQRKAVRQQYVEYAAKGFTKGALELLFFSTRSFPDLIRWLERLHDVRGLPWWVIYIKIAIPRPGSGLPILIYVGSGTSTTGNKTGGDSRFESHVKNAELDDKCLDSEEFHRLWKEHSEDCTLYFKELWLARDYVFYNDTKEEKQVQRRSALFVEGICMELIGTHLRHGTRNYRFDVDPNFHPCNKGSPFQLFEKKSQQVAIPDLLDVTAPVHDSSSSGPALATSSDLVQDSSSDSVQGPSS